MIKIIPLAKLGEKDCECVLCKSCQNIYKVIFDDDKKNPQVALTFVLSV